MKRYATTLLFLLACAACGDDPSSKVCDAERECLDLSDAEYEECVDEVSKDYDKLSDSDKKEIDEAIDECEGTDSCEFLLCFSYGGTCDAQSCDGVCDEFGFCVECVENTDCGSTQACHNDECRERCTEDADCPSGTCDTIDEVCGDEIGTPCSMDPVIDYYECIGLQGCIDVDADLATVEPYCTKSCSFEPCPDGYTCVSDECRMGGPGGSMCGGMSCDGMCNVFDECVECMSAEDCGPTQDCALDDTCRERCANDADCGGTPCFAGTCGDPIGTPCDGPGDCHGTYCADVDANLNTVPGYCTIICVSEPCPGGYTCVENECRKE